MTTYPSDTVSKPYRYKKMVEADADVEADAEQEKKEKAKSRTRSARHVTSAPAETSQGLGMKGSKLLTRQRAWQLKHPEKRQAHEAVKAAIRRGTLVRLPCQECGDPQTDAHHANGYDRAHWLDVEFLCRRHHAARHRRKIVKGPKG